MSLDWLTVAAQIVNFLVLVWLLQRFLYGPITRSMVAREAAFRARIDDAAETKRIAQLEKDRLVSERTSLESRRDELLAAARADVEQLRVRLEQEARDGIEARRKAWENDIAAEREEFIASLRRGAVKHFQVVARQALSGLAEKTLGEAMADALSDRLPQLDRERRDVMAAAIDGAHGVVVIESSHALTAAAGRRLAEAVRTAISADANVEFVRSQDLVCGVRLLAGGQALSWSLDTHLDRMEHEARQALEHSGPGRHQQAAQ